MAPNAALLPLHEHLRRHARATPDRAAYLWYGRTITWAELDAASDAFAARLVGISFAVEGRGGPARVKISREMMPLSEFLNIFGLSLQDVKNYLDE